MRSAFALSWNVQWLGSFPVSGTDPDTVSLRLDRFIPKAPPVAVQLSVSVVGVKVCTLEDKAISFLNFQQTLLCHSLRRVSCVVGRTERCQVAYIAREPTGETYRRLCHLFYTDAPHQVEEIESVLGNAFQAAAMARAVPSPQLPPKPSQRIIVPPTVHRASMISPSTPTSTPSMFASNEMNTKQRPIYSSALLHRLFGSKSRADSELFNKENGGANLTKRRRRPVSAVFSQAFHRLSSTSIYNKRVRFNFLFTIISL
uniref:PID domain-containing protein n=1 Tax=Ascaris lumbricoides TaxID=6252 RepID=A0A9J2PBE5_ASCLU